MITRFKHAQRQLSAFSLLETIISISVLAIIIVMLNGVIINFATAAQKTLARSFVREEVSSIVDQITSDIRSATRVGTCSGTLSTNAVCQIYTDTLYIWRVCDGTSVCKVDLLGNIYYHSSPQVILTELEFAEGLTGTDINLIQRNILVTVVGEHSQPQFNVKNIVRQVGVSTRNYVLL